MSWHINVRPFSCFSSVCGAIKLNGFGLIPAKS